MSKRNQLEIYELQKQVQDLRALMDKHNQPPSPQPVQEVPEVKKVRKNAAQKHLCEKEGCQTPSTKRFCPQHIPRCDWKDCARVCRSGSRCGYHTEEAFERNRKASLRIQESKRQMLLDYKREHNMPIREIGRPKRQVK